MSIGPSLGVAGSGRSGEAVPGTANPEDLGRGGENGPNAKRRPQGRRVRVGKRSDLEKRDVDGLGALVALLLLVGHPGALGERAIAVAVDAREVEEKVTAALGGVM